MRLKLSMAACLVAFAGMGTAHADDTATIKALQQQLDALQKQIQALQGSVSKVETAQAKQESSSPGISMVPGDDLIFQIGKSQVQLYGHADLSYDVQNSGLSGAKGATGTNGWLGDVSSNLSYFGVRGERPLNEDLKGVFQFETEIAYAATPGTSDQAADTTAQKTSLGARNSFIGLQSQQWGAVKLGKTDTPYKTSTARLDPFSSSVGDYNSIMGNTGGDTRAEFDLRLSHSIWYESPKVNGWQVSALVSPGQNRSTSGTAYALGEPDCTGGNTGTCNDGAFQTAYSGAVAYQMGPLYATAAYELHKSVNRSGDDNATDSVGVRDESAFKIGAQYAFTDQTTVNAIWEKLKRNAITASEDERSRSGTWLALTQKLTEKDALNFGWAHAFKTPGQPSGSPPTMAAGVGGAVPTGSVDNSANMYSMGYKHWFDKKTTGYLVYSQLNNAPYAHYALGVSGHGITTRNKDGDGNAFEGAHVKAVSVGVTYDF